MERRAEWPARGRAAVSPFPGNILEPFRVHGEPSEPLCLREEPTLWMETSLLGEANKNRVKGRREAMKWTIMYSKNNRSESMSLSGASTKTENGDGEGGGGSGRTDGRRTGTGTTVGRWGKIEDVTTQKSRQVDRRRNLTASERPSLDRDRSGGTGLTQLISGRGRSPSPPLDPLPSSPPLLSLTRASASRYGIVSWRAS